MHSNALFLHVLLTFCVLVLDCSRLFPGSSHCSPSCSNHGGILRSRLRGGKHPQSDLPPDSQKDSPHASDRCQPKIDDFPPLKAARTFLLNAADQDGEEADEELVASPSASAADDVDRAQALQVEDTDGQAPHTLADMLDGGASQHAAARYHTRKGTAAVVAAVTDAAQVGHGGRLCRGRAVGWAILPPLPQRGACRKRAEAASTMLLASIGTNVAL